MHIELLCGGCMSEKRTKEVRESKSNLLDVEASKKGTLVARTATRRRLHIKIKRERSSRQVVLLSGCGKRVQVQDTSSSVLLTRATSSACTRTLCQETCLPVVVRQPALSVSDAQIDGLCTTTQAVSSI